MDKLFVKSEYIKMLQDIFNSYCPEAEIWAYGSRVEGDAHEGSDLDLVVKSFNNDDKNIYELKELLNDSKIPFLIDVHEFSKLPKSFQEEIERKFVKFERS